MVVDRRYWFVSIAATLLLGGIGWADEPPRGRIYADEDYLFKLAVPDGWRSIDPAKIRVSGELRRAWSPMPPINISLFVQKFLEPAPDARKILQREAAAVKRELGAEI